MKKLSLGMVRNLPKLPQPPPKVIHALAMLLRYTEDGGSAGPCIAVLTGAVASLCSAELPSCARQG